jgi:hypothetical protein
MKRLPCVCACVRATGWNPTQLVQTANQFSALIGLPEPPALRAQTVGKMGLRGTPGLNVEKVCHIACARCLTRFHAVSIVPLRRSEPVELSTQRMGRLM